MRGYPNVSGRAAAPETGSASAPRAQVKPESAAKLLKKLSKLIKKLKRLSMTQLVIVLLLVAALAAYLIGAKACTHAPPTVVSGSDMLIHVVDVGEGDCTLVQGGGANILIDAGSSDTGGIVRDYLISHGVYTLDIVICTHPHADHIGGMDAVIGSPEIKAVRVLMPDIPGELVPYTRAYERLLDAIDTEGCEVGYISSDTEMSFGAMRVSLYAPYTRMTSDDLNDWSICARFECGQVSLLCCGDLTEAGEAVLLSEGVPLSSTVFKASHHGARRSNSRAFLEAVSPGYVYICVGRDNDFGHPSQRVLDDLYDLRALVLRTDAQGDIVFESDGSMVTAKAA